MKIELLPIYLLLLSLLFSCQPKDTVSPEAGKTELNIDFMLPGYVYASSAVEDTAALGGYGGSSNTPKSLNNSLQFIQSGFYLTIDTTQLTTFAERFKGFKLFIVNKSDMTVKLEASDSRLAVVAEALIGHKWWDIEYLPSSWCGNSYHNVYLKPNQYWEFSIPKYTGQIKTRIRYKLLMGKVFYLYSNEIIASINEKQLSEKQGHIPQGIMDPYNN